MSAPRNAMMTSMKIEWLVTVVVTPRYRARNPPAIAPTTPTTMSASSTLRR